MTRTLGNYISADLMLTNIPQVGEQQALEHLLTVLAEREYRQLIKDKRKGISGPCLSSTLHGQQLLESSPDHLSNLVSSIAFQYLAQSFDIFFLNF